MKTVMKIGGGILRNAEAFRHVAGIVEKKRKGGEEIAVVLSALYGVTDSLLDSIPAALKGKSKIKGFTKDIRQKHFTLLDKIKDNEIRETAIEELDDKIGRLEKFLFGLHYLKDKSPRTVDIVQSFGERLSPIVLEAFLLERGIPAELFDAEKAGIKTNGVFNNAIALMKETRKNIRKKVMPAMKNRVALITGFYGLDKHGNITTFGRGGTDYSAGIVAACIDAENLEIWKDVDGFMSADPRIVKNAKKIDMLSYSEAEELGYLGAKILHPKTISPIRDVGSAAVIKNIGKPDMVGTIISDKGKKTKEIIKSVTMMPKIAVITIATPSMVNTAGFAGKLFTAIGDMDIPIDLISTSETAISFSIPRSGLKRALKGMEEHFPYSKLEYIDDVAIVGVVGEGLVKTPGIAGKIFGVMGRNRINIELISQAAFEMNLSFIVKEKEAEKAIKAIHKEFIG